MFVTHQLLQNVHKLFDRSLGDLDWTLTLENTTLRKECRVGRCKFKRAVGKSHIKNDIKEKEGILRDR